MTFKCDNSVVFTLIVGTISMGAATRLLRVSVIKTPQNNIALCEYKIDMILILRTRGSPEFAQRNI